MFYRSKRKLNKAFQICCVRLCILSTDKKAVLGLGFNGRAASEVMGEVQAVSFVFQRLNQATAGKRLILKSFSAGGGSVGPAEPQAECFFLSICHCVLCNPAPVGQTACNIALLHSFQSPMFKAINEKVLADAFKSCIQFKITKHMK